MANTIDADLILDTISEKALEVAMPVLAPLGAFSEEFGLNEMAPSSDVLVEVVEAGSPTLVNTTDWDKGDTNIGKRKVEVNQYSQPFQITPAEMNQGIKLQKLAKTNMQTLIKKIMDVVTTPMTIANFGAGYEVDAGNFGSAQLKEIWGSKEDVNERNIILNSALYSNFLPTNLDSFDPTKAVTGMHGFDGFYHNARWNGAEADVVGFFGDSTAIAVASGLPVNEQAPDGEYVIREVIPLHEALGISCLFTMWYSGGNKRKWHGSFDLMFGAAAGMASAGKLLVNSVAD